jgi:nucleotide-binding universal stress UspA family protein
MYRRILVPIDGSATAQRGLQEAIALARDLRSTLVALYVCEPYPLLLDTTVVQAWQSFNAEQRAQGTRVLDKARAAAQEAGVACEAQLDESAPARASVGIVAAARTHRCELIVMGTHGRRGFDRAVMGSDAEQAVRTSDVPVLLVRSPEGA